MSVCVCVCLEAKETRETERERERGGTECTTYSGWHGQGGAALQRLAQQRLGRTAAVDRLAIVVVMIRRSVGQRLIADRRAGPLAAQVLVVMRRVHRAVLALLARQIARVVARTVARVVARRAAAVALQVHVQRMVFGQAVGVGGTEAVLGAVQVDRFDALLRRRRQVLRPVVGQVPRQRGGRLCGWFVSG